MAVEKIQRIVLGPLAAAAVPLILGKGADP